jgi:GNAT superfamily N-acetyltransferase
MGIFPMGLDRLCAILKGGPGSGHHGHAGRPGRRGGSAPGKGGSASVGITYYDPDEMYDMGDPYAIADKTGIYVSSDKEISSVAVLDEEIIGAAFTAANINAGEFSFDIVVSPEHQGKGIGSKLLDETLSEFRGLQNEFPSLVIEVDSVNPVAVSMLKKRGAEVTDVAGHHTYMKLE